MSFNNKTMRLPNNKFDTTPHIALIDGWWRVSPLPQANINRLKPFWHAAHKRCEQLNNSRNVNGANKT